MGDSVTIEMLPANYGDALHISYGDEVEQHHIWIDGGIKGSFKKGWEKRVRQLGQQGAELDLLVVTHIDADHINGVQAFVSGNQKGGHPPAIIPVRQVWFNQYRHIREYAQPRAVSGELGTDTTMRWRTRGEFVREVAGRAVALAPLAARLALTVPRYTSGLFRGPEEGEQLASLLGGDYPSNRDFNDKAVARSDVPPEVSLPGGARAWVLSPTGEKLADLCHVWEEYLAEKNLPHLLQVPGIRPEGAGDALVPGFVQHLMLQARSRFEAMLKGREEDLAAPIEVLARRDFNEDDSPANGSSIALLFEYAGHKLLLAGDAHPNVLVEGLQRLGYSAQFPLELDALKLSHHGSRANTNDKLLGMIRCDRYLISTNGKTFNHPDKECLARVIWANQERPDTVLYFNYTGTAAERAIADAADQQRYRYRIEHLSQGKPLLL